MEELIRKWTKFILVVGGIIFTFWFLSLIHEVLTIALLSFLLFYLLNPLVTILENRNISRGPAIGIVYASLLLAGVFSGIWLAPLALDQIISIKTGLEATNPTEMVEKLQKILVEKFSFLNPEQLDLVGKLRIFLKEMTGAIFDILLNAVSLVTTVIIVPFVTFFLLKEGREIKRAIIEKVPNRYFEMSLNLIHKIDQQISGYLRGIMLDAITVGILSIIGLYILNVTGLASVKYFIVIGALAGLANMVPYLGPIAGMIPAAALSIIDTGSFMSVVWIIVLFLVIQLIDEAVVYPTVVSSGVNLHPLTVIIALIVGGSLFGFIGLLVAVPVTGILKVTFTEIYIAIKKYHLL